MPWALKEDSVAKASIEEEKVESVLAEGEDFFELICFIFLFTVKGIPPSPWDSWGFLPKVRVGGWQNPGGWGFRPQLVKFWCLVVTLYLDWVMLWIQTDIGGNCYVQLYLQHLLVIVCYVSGILILRCDRLAVESLCYCISNISESDAIVCAGFRRKKSDCPTSIFSQVLST